MSIYCWTLGEQALARISKKVYAKVRIVKNEEGLFHDEKVLGISESKDGRICATEQLCYYVEVCRSKESLWLPYTSLRLAERSRPFYGPAVKSPTLIKPKEPVRKRKIKEDHTLPLSVAKLAKLNSPDLNTTFDFRQLPMRQTKYENAYKEFIRRGKDMIFDEFFFLLEKDASRIDDLDYLLNVDASTEDKFETVIKNIMTEKEVKNYLKQCWRYNTVNRASDSQNTQTDNSDNSNASSPIKGAVTHHINWCVVCGKKEELMSCLECPSSFHEQCRDLWCVTIRHRKTPSKPVQPQTTTIVEKVYSSTRSRVITKTAKTKENDTTDGVELCPSCMWGPAVGYGDVVWNKLGNCPWWPAKVLTPGSLPSCLVSRKHGVHQWPVKYYAENKYSWCDISRICLFLPSHTSVLDENRPEDLQQAVLDACDDYISVYLT